MAESSFFESQDDNEAFKAWRDSAFRDFNRELGPRISKRKTQELLGAFLNKQEGSQEELENTFQSFPGSAKEKAFNLLDKYKKGFLPNTLSANQTPEQIAAQKNIFTMSDINPAHLSASSNKFLTNWLGVKDIENKTMQFAPLGEVETFLGTTSYTNPARTGGQLVDAASESIDRPGNFYNELNKIGATPRELTVLDRYLNKNKEWQSLDEKTRQAASNSIDSVIQKAANSDSWVSFKEKDLPLFRGIAGSNLDPHAVGSTFTTKSPTSWTPVYEVAKAFATGATKQNPNNEPLMERMYVVTEYGDEARNKLLAPGVESEVLTPSKSKFEVTGIGRLKDDIFDHNIELIKLKQLYSLDPVTAGIQGGKNLLRHNITGSALGASTSLLNPEVAKSVEKNQYGRAAGTVARDVVGGALTEAGIKAAAPTAARYVPGLVRAATPLARFAGPVATGAALFSQGQTGSLTDVVTRKAANVVPGLKSDPKTDVGRRAGNEFLYMLNQFRRGRIPYTGK